MKQIRDERFGGSNMAMGGAAMAGAGLAMGQIVGVMDNRLDRNIAYGSQHDRMNVYMQQLTGASRHEMQQRRMGLLENRVDPTQMLGFEARFGVSATPQMAQGIEGIRHLTGYSMSTGDVLGVQQAMMNPEVINRMMMTTGQTMFEVGGGERDLFDVLRSTAGSMNLLGQDEEFLKGARRTGSMTRTRMAYSGIPEEMQELALDYAQAQLSFEKAGGVGEYDPRKEEHREILGDTENNLATQIEETDRRRAMREEKMFTNQMDAYVAMEKHQQAMVGFLENIDNVLSSAYGARARTRTFGRIAGAALKLGGAAAMLLGGPVGMSIGGAAIGIGATIGDPDVDGTSSGPANPQHSTSSSSSANDSNITVPIYGNKTANLEQVKSMDSFKKMHPTMQDRLLRLMRENPRIGFGQGYRSYERQKSMFLERYVRTDQKTDRFYDGSYWKKVRGADAAVPGRSMHMAGLAADLILNGQDNWLKQNAGRFGLKDFSGVNSEPWHVQPVELPNGFSQYEKEGAIWGLGPDRGGFEDVPPDDFYVTEGSIETDDHDDEHGAGDSSSGGPVDYSNMSMSEVLEQVTSTLGDRLIGGGTFNYRAGQSSNDRVRSGSRGSAPDQVSIGSHGEQLTGAQVASYAYNAGFRGEALVKTVAIAKGESGWKTGERFNPGYRPGQGNEDSYGLMQINMDPAYGADRRARYGLSSNEDLYDPNTNMRVSYDMSNQGTNFRPWTVYTRGKYRDFMAEAQQAVASINVPTSGDPEISEPRMISPSYKTKSLSKTAAPMTISVSSHAAPNNITVTVSPNINISGNADAPNIRQMAKQVATVMKQEVDLVMMRSS
jgi:hypothetical protein